MLEQAIQAGAIRQTGVAAIMAAAKKALALKRGVRPEAVPRPIELRHGPHARPATAVPVEPAPAAIAVGPRRTRAP